MLRRSILLALILGGLFCSGCHLVRRNEHWEPFPYRESREYLEVHSEFPLAGQSRLIDELAAERELIAERLHLPPSERTVHVYLFADDRSYSSFVNLRFPEFSSRRAVFVGTETELAVYAHWGEHVAEDLRHEVAHGYLHAVVPHLPLWLDEGLAEYFEVGPAQQGRNQAHIDYLAGKTTAAAWRPDLHRLETLESAADLTQQDYAEAWAWVHFFLQSDDKSYVLTDYLEQLRQGAAHARLSTSLGRRLARPELALAEHVQSLR